MSNLNELMIIAGDKLKRDVSLKVTTEGRWIATIGKVIKIENEPDIAFKKAFNEFFKRKLKNVRIGNYSFC